VLWGGGGGGGGGGRAVTFMFGWGASSQLSMSLHMNNEIHHYQRNIC
jgi:hypothetical protein